MAEKYQPLRKADTETLELTFLMNRTETECLISVNRKSDFAEIEPAAILDILEKRGIVRGIDETVLDEICEKIAFGDEVKDVVIAKGELATRDTDGYLEFLVRVSSAEPEFIADDTGQIDYKDTHFFDNVERGMKVAVLHRASRARDGFTVTGVALPAKNSGIPPKEIVVKYGDGIRIAGNEIFSTAVGRLVYEGDQLFITDQLRVKNNVGLDTGHIDFVGFVVIDGDVVDGFNVRGAKGVKVRHNIGDCRIESDGDIEIGGMNGRLEGDVLKSVIRCGGNLRARYLHMVDVECAGNVEVFREAMHCQIMAGGEILIKGTVAESKCVALAGIEAKVIGTVGEANTYLCAGKDFQQLEKCANIEKLIAENLAQQKKVEALIGHYTIADLSGMDDELREKLKKPVYFAEKLRVQLKQMKMKHQKILHYESASGANPKINIVKLMHQGTTIHLGRTRTTYQSPIKGPLSLIEFRSESIMPSKLSPLKLSAKQLEMKIIEKEKAEEAKAKVAAAREALAREKLQKDQDAQHTKPES